MVSRIFFALIGLLFMGLVYKQVKKKRFSEKESFFWMCTAFAMLVIAVFPQIIDYLTTLVHIDYPPSLLFLLAILFLVLIVFRLTEQVSILQERVKELAQDHAILEERVKLIEQQRDPQEASS